MPHAGDQLQNMIEIDSKHHPFILAQMLHTLSLLYSFNASSRFIRLEYTHAPLIL